MKQRFKHPGSKHNPGRTGDDFGGERAEQAGSLSRPASRIVAGGGPDREDNGSDADGGRIHSTDRTPVHGVSQPVPARGGNNDQEGEVSQRYSRPRSDIEVATGSEPGREGDGAGGETVGQVYHSPSAPSIQISGTPDGST